MSAVATAPSGATLAPEAPADARLFDPPGGEPSLEETVLGAWDELGRAGETQCLVCGGRITLANGCEDCGAELF